MKVSNKMTGSAFQFSVSGVFRTLMAKTFFVSLFLCVFAQSFFSGSATSLLGGTAWASDQKAKRPVVIELFTSQGCSSCPRADEVFRKLTKRDDVIALGFHVDYWDYLGWKDKMATSVNTNRQRTYGINRRSGSIFTPQVIIGGKVSVVGQNEAAINQAILDQSRMTETNVDVKLWETKKSLVIEIGAAPSSSGKSEGTVWLALIKKQETTKIRRGENRGRKITYHNIVHELSPVGRWMGKKMTLRLPRKQWMQRGSDGCVVLLQADDGTGVIQGAAQLASW